jgi:quercetin dioxygenase-like cupin family protein
MNVNATTLKGIPFNLEKHVNYADGSVVCRTLLQKDIGNITLFAFDSGQGLSEHILDGQAEITIGEKTHTVYTGEILIRPANVPHTLHAEKQFKMLLVMIRGE